MGRNGFQFKFIGERILLKGGHMYIIILKIKTKCLFGGREFQQRKQHQEKQFLAKDHGWKSLGNSQKASMNETE